jgi:bifunctional ADP-heptose synthase (sugar kinase/adenylyltransferase)
MAEFSKQGDIAVTGTILYTGSISNISLTKVLILRFNNPAAYDLKLEKYEAATSTTTTIYDLTLAAGDTVTDNLSYALNAGDELIATSNIVGTTYYIYGVDYASS